MIGCDANTNAISIALCFAVYPIYSDHSKFYMSGHVDILCYGSGVQAKCKDKDLTIEDNLICSFYIISIDYDLRIWWLLSRRNKGKQYHYYPIVHFRKKRNFFFGRLFGIFCYCCHNILLIICINPPFIGGSRITWSNFFLLLNE